MAKPYNFLEKQKSTTKYKYFRLALFGPRISDSCIYTSVDRSSKKFQHVGLVHLAPGAQKQGKKCQHKFNSSNSGLENCDNVPDAGAKGDVRGRARSQIFNKIFSLAELFSREMELGQYLASPIMAV